MRAFRIVVQSSVLAAIFACGAHGAEPVGVREIDRLHFVGVESVNLAEIRDALGFDLDLLLASHPNNSLDKYLEALEKRLQAGYLHSGFPDAAIHPVFDEAEGQIAVYIREGQRYQCGEVQVVGVTQVPTARLIRVLTENDKPTDILWKQGNPVPFDEVIAAEMRRRIEWEFRQMAFFDPDFKIRIVPDRKRKVADLHIAVAEDGPLARLGKISVAGSKRDSQEDVLRYLALPPGTPFDSGLPGRIEKRLRASGRYLSISVKEKSDWSRLPQSSQEARDLQITLRDYKHAPALTADFSPAEEALLKLQK